MNFKRLRVFYFIVLDRIIFQLMGSTHMIPIYHQVKTPISFWCKQNDSH